MKMMIMATVILMENCQTKINLATALHASLENTKIVQIIGGRPAKNNRRAAEVKSFKAVKEGSGKEKERKKGEKIIKCYLIEIS